MAIKIPGEAAWAAFKVYEDTHLHADSSLIQIPALLHPPLSPGL
jgi:hypothetical protein